MRQLTWLAGGDPVKIEAFNRMPLIEYYILLDQKISDIQQANNRSKKYR